MLDLSIQAPIQKLMWEERERLGTVPAPWGIYFPFALGRKGGWAVLQKGDWDLPAPEVVVLGKCT